MLPGTTNPNKNNKSSNLQTKNRDYYSNVTNINYTVIFLQVFLLTVVFGLFHGLVFLPVILTILGPTQTPDDASDKYASTDATNSTTDNDHVSSPELNMTSPVDAAKVASVVGSGLVNPAFVHDAKQVKQVFMTLAAG